MTDTLTPPNLESLKVLYVEDDLETRDELELILRMCVGELIVAANGREGLDLFRQHAPDIVLSDIQMPEMNGLTMASEIRKLKPDQTIIILSAYNDVEYLYRALELGIDHYITKPIQVERLLDKFADIACKMALEQNFLRNRKLLNQYKLLVDEKANVVKLDAQGIITYVNRHFCDLSGYLETELLQQHYAAIWVLNDQENVFPGICEALKKARKWQGILKNRTKAGDYFTVDMTVVAIEDTDGSIEEYVALMVDVTEIYAKFERLSITLEHDLTEQRHYLKEYERAMNLGTSLCILNTEGIITSANQNFTNNLNYLPEELIGRHIRHLGQDCSDFDERIMNKVKAQGYTSRVIKLAGKDGYERTFSTVIVAIHDQQGGIYSLMGLSQDISDSVRLSEEIMETQKELIYVMGEVVENRSQETGMHIRRVAESSALIAAKYGLSEEHVEMIKIASPMHDIGKVGIPDAILHKPGKLSEAEFTVMQTHADLGFTLLNKLNRPLVQMAAKIAHEHHEHYDGHGYPRGIEGERISIEGRIVSLIDVVDALGSRRAYKEPWSDDKILDYVISKRGTQFDPELVDILVANYEEIKAIRERYQDKIT